PARSRGGSRCRARRHLDPASGGSGCGDRRPGRRRLARAIVTRVKLCGLTSHADVALCAGAGADALGFVGEFPLPLPWTLDRRRAAELMRGVPPFATRVAVVGGDAATVLEIAEVTTPDAVQLHLDEDEATVEAVKNGLAGTGIRIVKAIRIRAG